MRLGAPKSVLAGLAIALVLPASAAPTAPGRNGLIAFVIHPYSGEIGNGIVVVRADGSHRRSVTHNIGDRSPAWSPDGQRLAFERAGRIDVVMADGSGLRRLTHGSTGNHQPAWSPDGRSIAFTQHGALFVMRADGSRRRSLFRVRGDYVGRPSWSPDGKWIAFGLDDGGEGGSIAVISSAGGEPRYVTEGVEPDESTNPGDLADDYDPDWSPDGTRIVFTRVVWFCGRCDQDEVFSAKADGSDVRWLTRDTTYASSRPSWSPDGSMLLAETSGGLGLFTASGTLVRMLDAYGAEAAWQPLAIAHDVGPVTARGRAS